MPIQLAQCSRRQFQSENNEKNAVSFLHEKNNFFDNATRKTRTTCDNFF